MYDFVAHATDSLVHATNFVAATDFVTSAMNFVACGMLITTPVGLYCENTGFAFQVRPSFLIVFCFLDIAQILVKNGGHFFGNYWYWIKFCLHLGNAFKNLKKLRQVF